MPVRLSADNVEGVTYVKSTCGRCGGSGQLQAWDPTTRQPIAVWCGVCSGTGEAQRFLSEGNPATPLPAVRRYADGRR